jgi:hypothetical protein
MSSTVYYDSVNELALLAMTFVNAAGTPTDPTTVTCTVTDPSNTSVTHTYGGAAPADITRVSAGKFTLSVACSPAVAGADGLWGAQWTGTGTVTAIEPVTWRVLPAAISQVWYVGAEEMNDRLGITDTADMSSMQFAIAATAGWINSFCGRHFNQVTETRTFQPYDIWLLNVDDIVPGAAITVNVDQDGDGTYETPMVLGTDFQLRLGDGLYNVNATGTPRPYRQLQVIQSGKWWPFTWPYTHLDRVQIATTWGWLRVPWEVTEANRILAADLFKMKDAPFGIAGVSDLGVLRIQSNPWLVELLHDYINPKRKVGV